MYRHVIEIEQVLYRCCHAVDQGNIDRIMSVFHPNAKLIINWEENGIYIGQDEIRKWFVDYNHVVKSSLKYLRHKISCPMIEINGDEATSFSYFDADAAIKDVGQVIITAGRYEDKFVRSNGLWCFKEKAIFKDNTYSIQNDTTEHKT